MRLALLVMVCIVLPCTSAAPPGVVYFCAAGDVMLARGVADRMRVSGPDWPFSGIAPILKRQHLALCNFECQIGTRGQPTNKLYHFICPPESASGLVASGFNIFSLANNHIYDYGLPSFVSTEKFLERNGLYAVGAGLNRWEALEPAVIEKNGLRVAVFAFTSFWPLGFDGKAPRDPQPAKPDSQGIYYLISTARKTADAVVVSYHWGKELTHYPSDVQKRYGRTCIDAGADLVIGHHPHAIQTIEKYKGKFIFYSLGNCVFDQNFEMGTEGLLLACTLTKSGVVAPSVRPLRIRNCRPVPATGGSFLRIERKLRKYCARSNVTIKSQEGRLFLY